MHENAPLSRLVQEFSLLCAGNSPLDPKNKAAKPSAPLTYESVLALFEEALASNDWPVDDKAIPFVPADEGDTIHVARPESTWFDSQNSQAEGSQGSGAVPRNRLVFPPELRNHPAVLRQWRHNTLSMGARNAQSSAAEPHTPRTTSSGSQAPSVDPQRPRLYLPDPDTPSPSVRGRMLPPPIPPRFPLPAPDIGLGLGRAHSQGERQDTPAQTRVRPQPSGSSQSTYGESSGSTQSERHKRSHGEYEADAGESSESSTSSKRVRTRRHAPPPSTHRMELRKRSGSGPRK